MQLTLTRGPSTDEGTFGRLTAAEGALDLHTVELPWRDNQAQHSCIPPGVYQAGAYDSPSKGRVYLLREVPGRTLCEIHSANFAGDVTRGWESQLLGCIAVGLGVAVIPNQQGRLQRAVLNSRAALARLFQVTGGAPITLTIQQGS
jgi:hypothetical protein